MQLCNELFNLAILEQENYQLARERLKYLWSIVQITTQVLLKVLNTAMHLVYKLSNNLAGCCPAKIRIDRIKQ